MRFKIRCAALLTALVMSVFAAGCASDSGPAKSNETMARATEERLTELADLFVDDLKAEIIPVKENVSSLTVMGLAVVTASGKVHNLNAIRSFHEAQAAKRNTSLTFADLTSGFVVTRIVFEGDFGYYMRYTYDPKASGPVLPIACRLVDSTAIAEDEAEGTFDFILLKDKKDVVTITFIM